MLDKIILNEIAVSYIIGLNPPERITPQPIFISVTLYIDLTTCGESDNLLYSVDYASLTDSLIDICKAGNFYTIEACAYAALKECLTSSELIEEATVYISKPNALLTKAKSPAVEMHRKKKDFQHAHSTNIVPSSRMVLSKEDFDDSVVLPYFVEAYLAFGTNLGNRVENINSSLRFLTSDYSNLPPNAAVSLLDTSFLYETPPAYVLDQPAFLNGAVKVRTNLTPMQLLDHIKRNVESQIGRNFAEIRHGPRLIDLDILFYDSSSFQFFSDELQVPHMRIHERDFVLGPLLDVLSPSFVHPGMNRSLGELFRSLPAVHLERVTPSIGSDLIKLKRKTHVMGILNVTPDSFSDGGLFFSEEAAFEAAKGMIRDGADMIDVGGQSTRPGAQQISPEEELARVIPVLRKIISWQREQDRPISEARVPISVDTFYASVARAAFQEGAAIINDVSGGDLDSAMLQTMAELKVPLVMMHMRGYPGSMQSLAKYSSLPAGSENFESEEEARVVEDVKRSLQNKIQMALQVGIFRWNIILDPGLGFAKLPMHSFALLKPKGRLVDICDNKIPTGTLLSSFPILYGPSRKGFLGSVTGRSIAEERDFATAAAVTAAVSIGADIVRVHAIRGTVDVVRVADAIYKS
jgi:dihydroneopterin aldolase/2-amino-4-hydroxy-6-hydroxymethyldihydropteridine diphosphokinase/dihydropteroate synthase/2-amino-4-hydroxy-6-hydroxymethyldihydropteridine diphosphokinase/dihydropteroate synthase